MTLGTLNTAVLLTSSLSIALADFFVTSGRGRLAFGSIAATALLGIAFLVIKAAEYAIEISEGIAPVLGLPFAFDGPDPVHARFFFQFYFAMTGLHALHLFCGIGVLAGMLLFWQRLAATSRVRAVTAIGLYWHFVDIVWCSCSRSST